ncbi:hypothetical protein [Candidatus Binatus sp.]|uniref:hypothetical protein n=1 Tax=Candidatus Binatus sp. TaxID=2811406 RepID=UPI003BB1BDF0
MTSKNEIDDLARALQTEADKYNKTSPNVTQLLGHADERFAEANPGVAAWLDNLIEKSDEDIWWSDQRDYQGDYSKLGITFEAYQVGYARVGEGWGLASRVVRVNRRDGDGQEGQQLIVTKWHQVGERVVGAATINDKVVPIRNAPMAVRIRALALVPKLLRELTDQVRTRNAAIEEATKRLEK